MARRSLSLLLCAGSVLLLGCPDTESNPDPLVSVDASFKDGSVFSDAVKLDATPQDATALTDGSGDNASTEDTGPVPGGFEWPCTAGTDCTSGFCVPSAAGMVCTDTCFETCPAGWSCVYVNQGGADNQFICLQRSLNLCKPCKSDLDCAAADGLVGDMCLNHGTTEGSFCGTACTGDKDCTAGYLCKDTPVAGIKQCQPESGACTCSAYAVQQAAATTCASIEAGTGSCVGERVCTAAGLSGCSAPKPGLEVCDNADNDCDGTTDEELDGLGCAVKNDFGACAGTTECKDGKTVCVGQLPKAEACDGIDNDCNAKTDEGFPDLDEDGTADCSDPDDDDDSWQDDLDDCPVDFDPDQTNSDDDGWGNACDDDDDNDGVLDAQDNCPLVANITQIDSDGNGVGDACDLDVDGDLVFNEVDNCVKVPNPDQADFDLDGAGDACDPDDDADAVLDTDDNCPLKSNPGQEDQDGDLLGDVCDPDADGDGKLNVVDNCPYAPNVDQLDWDGDGAGDACDPDDDADGVKDVSDNCPSVQNPDQKNSDADGIGDACDDDDDDDGVLDGVDNCPDVPNDAQTDSDGDGQGNACDLDLDGDGVPDASDNCPLLQNGDQLDTDADGQGNACDIDDDGDQVPDTSDICPLNANPLQQDQDLDGLGDACDPDLDGDLIPNAQDNCPSVPNTAQGDTDLDGAGDLCDDDDDNDALPDAQDNCPTIANAGQEDLDGDKKGDVCDPDDDNDGAFDTSDNCPLLQNADQKDTDGDGLGDACDGDDDNDGDADESDCGPTDPTTFHGAQEQCNGKDDNCVFGADEEGSQGCVSHYLDTDKDGYGQGGQSKCLCTQSASKGQYTATQSGDCDDGNKSVHPNAGEICNGVDDDCDTKKDPEGSGGCSDFYYDGDSDGWGLNDKKCLCGASGAYKAAYKGKYDCNDSNGNVNPGADEVCGGADENCNGTTDEQNASGCKTYYPDADGDGYGAKVTGKCLCKTGGGYVVENSADCYDSNGSAYPGQTQWFSSNRGDGSFDYDCDGASTLLYTQVGGHCDTTLGFCSGTQNAYQGGSPPSCGNSANWVTGCSSGFFSCSTNTTSKQQLCH